MSNLPQQDNLSVYRMNENGEMQLVNNDGSNSEIPDNRTIFECICMHTYWPFRRFIMHTFVYPLVTLYG